MKRVLLILAITAVGVLMTFVDAYWGLLLYTWYSFASPLELTYGMLAGTRLSLIVGGLLLVTTIFQKKSFCVYHPISVLMYFFLFSAFFSLAAQMQFSVSTIFQRLELLSKIVIISALTPVLLTNLSRLRWYIFTIGFSGGLLGCYYGIFGLAAGSMQIHGPGRIGDNNGYSVFLAAMLPFVFYSSKYVPLFSLSPFRSIATLVLVLGNCLAVVLTYSRGGFLATSFVILLLLAKVKSLVGRLLGWGIILPTLLFAAWTVFSVNPDLIEIPTTINNETPATRIINGYVTRLRTLRGDIENESSAGGRLHFWRVAGEMIKDNPVFGVGLGQYSHQYSKYDFSDGEFGAARATHNTFLLIFSELGGLGFLMFVGMLVFLSLSLSRAKYRLSLLEPSPEVEEYYSYISMIRISLCGYLLGGMFVNVPFQEIFWSLLSISISIDVCSLRLIKDMEVEQEA